MQQRAVVPFISRFEPVIEQFVPFLRATVQRLNLPSASHDLTQEAKRRFRQMVESEGESTLVAATLYRLSVAATLETVRAAKKQKEAPAIVWVEMTAAARSEAETQQSLSRLQTTLAQLPENRRRPVALQLLGLSSLEIGTLLGWSEAKTRQQTERGLRTLRTKLREASADQKVDETELKTIYQAQPTRTELNRADCLADEFLARACAGDINAADRFFVADHLTTCRDCAEEYQLVHALKLWADEAAKPVSHPKESEVRAVEISEAPITEPTSRTEAWVAPEAAPEVIPEAAPKTREITPKWWQALIPRFVYYTGFNLFTAALTGLFFVTSLSLATWLVAIHFRHKTELNQVRQQQIAALASAEPATPEMVQARLEEAQKQLTDLQTQITEQNADKVLSNQELLGIQNDTLQKELDELSKPQLDAPVVDIDLAALRATAEPGKEIVTTIDVPNTSSVFTVILHKPAEKNAANYLLELFDAKKPKAVWSAQKKLEAQTKIAVTLAKRNYPAGKYRFTLSGVEGKKKELLETYQIEVKYQPPPKQKKKK